MAAASAAMVIGVWGVMAPKTVDVLAAPAGDRIANLAENKALLVSAGLAGAIAIISGDEWPFIVGGALAVSLALMQRHANTVDPSKM